MSCVNSPTYYAFVKILQPYSHHLYQGHVKVVELAATLIAVCLSKAIHKTIHHSSLQ